MLWKSSTVLSTTHWIKKKEEKKAIDDWLQNYSTPTDLPVTTIGKIRSYAAILTCLQSTERVFFTERQNNSPLLHILSPGDDHTKLTALERDFFNWRLDDRPEFESSIGHYKNSDRLERFDLGLMTVRMVSAWWRGRSHQHILSVCLMASVCGSESMYLSDCSNGFFFSFDP